MRLLITEEGLVNTRGHFLEYIKDIVSACQERGIHATVLAHKQATAEVLDQLPAVPAHPESVWSRSAQPRNPLLRIARILRHNFRLKKTLIERLQNDEPHDCILAPTNLVDHVLGHYLTARWLRRRNFNTHYVLLFVDSVGTYDEGFQRLSFPRRTLILRFFMRLFRKLIDEGRVTFCTETEEMARHYGRFCGMPFKVVPHVVTFPIDKLEQLRQTRSHPRGPATFGSFGFTRFDKGTDLLQAAVALLLTQWPETDARFLIQWDRDIDLGDGRIARIDQTLAKDERVTFITELFSKEQYLRYLSETDIIVLPYRKFFYFDRLSRVAIDAAIAGLPFLAPRETWLSRFQESHGAGLAFTPEDIESLAAAMKQAIDEVDGLTRLARERMEQAASDFGPHAFLDQVKSFCRPNMRQRESEPTDRTGAKAEIINS